MILLVDVGNTNIVIGVYKENECIVSWRISTDTKKTSDEYSIQVMQLLNQYDLNPKEVGADRIVNAVAAHDIYKRDLIILDFGTATTYCAVTKEGDYLGGCISPGVKIASDALFERAAKLPRIELEVPKSVICKNTITSMQAGILYGYIGQVEYIVRRMKREMNELGIDNPYVIATGGLANLIAKETDIIDKVDSSLTLEGLRIIYEKNKE